jgi:hypothetical protein
MIYVFDTSSLSKLKHFYPTVFKTLWDGLDTLVKSGNLISTREIWNELERGAPDKNVNAWLKDRRKIFTTPSGQELSFVAQILSVLHFQSLIGETQRLKGTPVADSFIIACERVRGGAVVTEELVKPNAAKIPNICEYFGNILCITLEQFMQSQNWGF